MSAVEDQEYQNCATRDGSGQLGRKSHGLLDDAEISQLSVALLAHYEPDLVRAKSQLTELTKKQQTLIEQLQCENERFELSNSEYNLHETFAKVKVYHAKLVNLKKEMAQLHEKSTKLKKRALKLQEQRQKEALQRELNREREMQREQQLIQPSTSGAAGSSKQSNT